MGKSKNVKLRKKEAVDEIIEERILKSKEKESGKDQWHKHWEKDKDSDIKHRLGGGKRPKTFNFNEEDDLVKREQEAKEREEKEKLRDKKYTKKEKGEL